ncbi:hypothetical protein [Halobaculum marinum]|uniref:Dolichyl-phosphate-mannose-protein mannosyltransferase n=1 Tax=Halobaculum marinum TaxID=3031996 RepID=A0ABD5WS78_9EURY|nr:hypothetical protein [Halobaculum sp. DT55]
MSALTRERRLLALPLGVCLLLAVGLLAAGVLGLLPQPTLVRAGFTLGGAVVAALLFVGSMGERQTVSRRLPPRLVTKGVLVLAGSGVIATALIGSRVIVFAVVLTLGLGLVALQLRAEPSVPAVLTQLGGLFLASRLGKYLTTDVYFGGTDTFAHVAAVDTLVRVRYWAAIPHGYDLYPVFHLLVGTVRYATGLQSYDALVLTGIGLFTLVVPLAYLLGRSVFGSRRLGLLAALSVTVLEFFSYHAVYFYPQALASILVLVALFVNSHLRYVADERAFRRLSVFVIGLVATMTITHHLTYLLFAVVAVAAVPVALARPYLFDEPQAHSYRWFRYRWLFPGVVGGVFLLAYWSYSPSLITVGIVQLTLGVLFDVAVAPAEQLYTYGATLPADTVGRAFEWLSTATGIYAVGLSSILLLAGYELIDHLGTYRRGFTLTVTGLGLSALLIPVPISIPQIERLKFVVTLVAIFPVAVGLGRVLSVDRRYAAAAVLLVAAMGGATGFTVLAADDVSGVYLDEPREQVSMSDDQYRAVGTTAAFIERSVEEPVATDKITNRAFETYRFNATARIQAEPGGLRTDAPFLVVRDSWTDHIVALGDAIRRGGLGRLAVGDDTFERTDTTVDKVYTNEHVRIYYSEDGHTGVYGANTTVTTPGG